MQKGSGEPEQPVLEWKGTEGDLSSKTETKEGKNCGGRDE